MGATWIALVLLMQWAAYLRSANTLSDDGASLLAAKDAWKASLNWTGDDPCQLWEGVRCNINQRVIYLNLSDKGVTGPIPQEIANLQYLENLDLSNLPNTVSARNVITGDLSVLGGLTNLRSLNLSFNAITLAQFPKEIYNFANLTDLIDNNNLQGPLPKDISKLTKLQYVYLGNNSLSGPLPGEWGALVNLLELSLWNNNLQSQVPPEFGNLVNLRYLNLHDCQLYGGLPAELGNITSLQTIYFYGNEMTGTIPEYWSKLTNLQELKLDNNHFTKYFPDWTLEIPNLAYLNLAYNYFYGAVPNLSSSRLQNFNISCNFFSGTLPKNSTTMVVFDQHGNCFQGSDSNQKRKCYQDYFSDCTDFNNRVPNGSCIVCPQFQNLEDKTSCVCTMAAAGQPAGQPAVQTGGESKLIGPIVGVGLFFIIIAILLSWRWIKFKKQHSSSRYSRYQEMSTSFEVPGVRQFSLQEISRATEDFHSNHEIGVGGSGKVFYGVLDDGRKVAIKRAESVIQSSLMFRNEVMLLSRLHHRNLVHLLGFCEDHGVQILVYEYMPNGDLQSLLHKNKGEVTLDWLMRLNIAAGIAQGLEYLHSFADPPVIHRDVKPSNVLLDERMVAKLADFGLSRATPEFDSNFFTKLAGTVGYMDPQYILRHHLTTASDVYSFGMVLLEIISGQKSVDLNRLDDQNLVGWVRIKMNSNGVRNVVDPRLGNGYPEKIFQDLVRLGIDCASFNSEDRPSMKAVVTILDTCLWAIPPELLEVVHDPKNSEDRNMKSDEQSLVQGSMGPLTMSFVSSR